MLAGLMQPIPPPSRYEYVVEAPTEDVMDFLLPVSVSG